MEPQVSRGDQIDNARCFRDKGYCRVLQEQDLSKAALLQAIDQAFAERIGMVQAMEESGQTESVAQILKLIEEL